MMPQLHRFVLACIIPLCAILVHAPCVSADDAAPARRSESQDDEDRARSTAVALNFCRASFHRIKRYPSKRVLIEEQEKILNNLDLNGIADEEVIRLYSSVLEEIGHVQIADREREVMRDKYKDSFYRQLGATTFVLGAEIATAQFMSAIRTGANSWWDYRESGLRRDLDLMRIDKQRMTAVVSKSSQFLDTFWKMAQKRNIPDRWLVRGNDLDSLEEAVREADPQVRLRVLKRMERFMECYPPYWYHIARTQQSMGQLFAAAKTYDRLADLSAGYFRKDDMLAAGLANRAAIQEYLRQPSSVRTAQEALQYSTDVWQANLMCARVLERHGKLERAEDAILRNLDVKLEHNQSTVALVSLYYHSGQKKKLMSRLGDHKFVARLPMPILLQCVAGLDTDRMPSAVKTHIAASLSAFSDWHIGRDDLVVRAMPAWRLNDAAITMQLGERHFEKPVMSWSNGTWNARFRGVVNLPSPFTTLPQNFVVALSLKYPEAPPIRVSLKNVRPRAGKRAKPPSIAAGTLSGRRSTFQIANIDFGTEQIALLPLEKSTETTSDSKAANENPKPDDVKREAKATTSDKKPSADHSKTVPPATDNKPTPPEVSEKQPNDATSR